MFQSTHPHGVRQSTTFHLPRSKQFQSTHPHGVRRIALGSAFFFLRFNPRTHMGCDGIVQGNGYFDFVSIHAPTWGATCLSAWRLRASTVSIHAPTWGATRPSEIARQITQVSIHAPTWGATFSNHVANGAIEVSIHAPTWGATVDLGNYVNKIIRFNPRTHMGCDKYTTISTASLNGFQSTHPHGVRQKLTPSVVEKSEFQSTHPHGVRPEGFAVPFLQHLVSIHAPTWGATAARVCKRRY